MDRLALTAFMHVLGRKQTSFRPILAWLEETIEKVRPCDRKEVSRLFKVAKEGDAVFRGYRF